MLLPVWLGIAQSELTYTRHFKNGDNGTTPVRQYAGEKSGNFIEFQLSPSQYGRCNIFIDRLLRLDGSRNTRNDVPSATKCHAVNSHTWKVSLHESQSVDWNTRKRSST
jgi:hypothetical protein